MYFYTNRKEPFIASQDITCYVILKKDGKKYYKVEVERSKHMALNKLHQSKRSGWFGLGVKLDIVHELNDSDRFIATDNGIHGELFCPFFNRSGGQSVDYIHVKTTNPLPKPDPNIHFFEAYIPAGTRYWISWDGFEVVTESMFITDKEVIMIPNTIGNDAAQEILHNAPLAWRPGCPFSNVQVGDVFTEDGFVKPNSIIKEQYGINGKRLLMVAGGGDDGPIVMDMDEGPSGTNIGLGSRWTPGPTDSTKETPEETLGPVLDLFDERDILEKINDPEYNDLRISTEGEMNQVLGNVDWINLATSALGLWWPARKKNVPEYETHITKDNGDLHIHGEWGTCGDVCVMGIKK